MLTPVNICRHMSITLRVNNRHCYGNARETPYRVRRLGRRCALRRKRFSLLPPVVAREVIHPVVELNRAPLQFFLGLLVLWCGRCDEMCVRCVLVLRSPPALPPPPAALQVATAAALRGLGRTRCRRLGFLGLGLLGSRPLPALLLLDPFFCRCISLGLAQAHGLQGSSNTQVRQRLTTTNTGQRVRSLCKGLACLQRVNAFKSLVIQIKMLCVRCSARTCSVFSVGVVGGVCAGVPRFHVDLPLPQTLVCQFDGHVRGAVLVLLLWRETSV